MFFQFALAVLLVVSSNAQTCNYYTSGGSSTHLPTVDFCNTGIKATCLSSSLLHLMTYGANDCSGSTTADVVYSTANASASSITFQCGGTNCAMGLKSSCSANTPTVYAVPGNCLSKTKYACLANGMVSQASYNDSACTATQLKLYSTFKVATCILNGFEVPSCVGGPTSTFPAGDHQTIQYSASTDSTCAAVTMTSKVVFKSNTCDKGSKTFCRNGGAATVSYQKQDCTGSWSAYQFSGGGICRNSSSGYAKASCSGGSRPSKNFATDVGTQQHYSGATCSGAVYLTAESALNLCVESYGGGAAKATCNATHITVVKFAAIDCSGTSTPQVTLELNKCNPDSSGATSYKWTGCGPAAIDGSSRETVRWVVILGIFVAAVVF